MSGRYTQNYFLSHIAVLTLFFLSTSLAQEQTDVATLSRSFTWRALLHTTQDLMSANYSSEIDSEEFFLAANGKTNLHSELEATIHYFFSPDLMKQERLKIICKFPARYEWLREQQPERRAEPVEQLCPEIDQALRERNTNKISLIFAESFLDKPASMFGHTFLRFENKDFKRSRLLDQTLNFAADSHGITGIEMVIKGLFGGFQGRFFGGPYYIRIKQYGDIDHRDLWEYSLNLCTQEIRMLELHLWELKDAFFNYYFFDENCSYHLFTFLKLIRPDANLFTQQFRYVIPSDTIRALKSIGLISTAPIRRVSEGNRLLALETELSQQEKLTAKRIAKDGVETAAESMKALSLDAQARVLDGADALCAFNDSTNAEANCAQRSEIALARSKIATVLQPVSTPTPLISDPLKGHKPSRFKTALGQEYWQDDSRFFYGLSARPALHSVLDPSEGYLKNSELIFVEPEIRFYPDDDSLSFERMTIVQIRSLPARKFLLQPYSWGMNMDFRRIRIEEHGREMSFAPALLGGLSYDIFPDMRASILGTGQAYISHYLENSFETVPGALLQVQWNRSDSLQLQTEIGAGIPLVSESQPTYTVTFSQSYKLSDNLAQTMRLSRFRNFAGDESLLEIGLQYYFSRY